MAVIVYITTNLINGKKYLGKHNGKNPNYLGSGLAIKYAVKKYGKQNFSREIVSECSSDMEAFVVEENLSKKWNVVNDPLWYNMKVGGKGFASGSDHPQFGKPRSADHTHNLVLSRLGWKHSEESKAKISMRNVGSNNPMYGLRGSQHPAFGHGSPKGPRGPQKFERTAEHCVNISLARRGKGMGQNNAMALEENRRKVGQSKIGKRKHLRDDGSCYMAYPSGEKT